MAAPHWHDVQAKVDASSEEQSYFALFPLSNPIVSPFNSLLHLSNQRCTFQSHYFTFQINVAPFQIPSLHVSNHYCNFQIPLSHLSS
jgi:hypothetical protein